MEAFCGSAPHWSTCLPQVERLVAFW
jgi:hypothetical protein